MQDDNHQDFFEFDENFRKFLEREQSARSRTGRKRLLSVVVVCAVVITAVATVLGIFRSDDTAPPPGLRQTFPIESPPPPRRAVPQDTVGPATAANLEKHAAAEGPPAGEMQGRHSRQAASRTVAEKRKASAITRGTRQPGAGGAASGNSTHKAPPFKGPSVQQKSPPPPEPSSLQQKSPAPVPAIPAPESVPPSAAASFQTAGPAPSPAPADATETNPTAPSATDGLPDLTAEIQGGRLQNAARRFARYLRDHPGRYSISVEVACQPRTVVRAFTEVKAAGKMFILPIKLGQRDCYALLWGVYASIGEARAAKVSVPPFFTAQTTPRVVGLFRYLESR